MTACQIHCKSQRLVVRVEKAQPPPPVCMNLDEMYDCHLPSALIVPVLLLAKTVIIIKLYVLKVEASYWGFIAIGVSGEQLCTPKQQCTLHSSAP